MNDSWQENARIMLINAVPLLATILLMFLFYMPIHMSQTNFFRPTIGVICVYYWTIRKKDSFGYFAAFRVGFLTDIYSSSPLGTNVLMMMFFVFVLHRLSKLLYALSFCWSWVSFIFIGLAFILLKWLLLSLYHQSFLSLTEVLLNFISTVMFYPLIVSVNVWLQNKFLPQEGINE
ncbi:MAG: rod shape-determining protein MreD [Alphaproteobacteria bacterium]|nr:rod shape-determining protein MreD [Alphaproteobacteria bacterium]